MDDYKNIHNGNQEEDERLLLMKAERYEILMSNISVTVFDYVIETKSIINSGYLRKTFGADITDDNTIEKYIELGFIHSSSVNTFRNLFYKIDNGEPFAEGIVVLHISDTEESYNRISLTTIYDDLGNPIRAVGIIEDITGESQLEKEKLYRCLQTSDMIITYEADISSGVIQNVVSCERETDISMNFEDYGTAIHTLANLYVHPDDKNEFLKFTDPKTITNLCNGGKVRVDTQLRMKLNGDDYIWVNHNMNIIKMDLTGDIKVRCNVSDINEKKEQELKSMEEKIFYETMTSSANVIYEVNLTNDTFEKTHENNYLIFEFEKDKCYSHMIWEFINHVVFPEDFNGFVAIFLRENLLESFENGCKEFYYEYRVLTSDYKIAWYSCTMHILRDPIDNNVMGYCYIEDISDRKVKELDLIYKSEHDILTGLLNKDATEYQINNYLRQEEAKNGIAAFFMLDIDHFKAINDNFGHLFGDAVLAEVSGKILQVFRDDDIVGRIGGDEFCVLVKNVPNMDIVTIRAKELCDVMHATYFKNGISFDISLSVGIAIFDKDGDTFIKLYDNADSALYISKNKGRSIFTIYQPDMEKAPNMVLDVNGTSTPKQNVDYPRNIIRSFSENISEYMFRILYESNSKEDAINAVLGLIGKHYNFSRAYIFEDLPDGSHIRNTFEWCNTNIEPVMDKLQNISFDDIGDYKNCFDENGIYFLNVENLNSLKIENELLSMQNIKSLLHFSIVKNDVICGLIGFDQCDYMRKPTADELRILQNVANILGVFIIEMRAAANIEDIKNVALSIVNGLSSYAYIVDRNSFDLVFLNKNTKDILQMDAVGDKCYRVFFKRDTPCESCPVKYMSDHNIDKYSKDVYVDSFDKWIKLSAAWVDWTRQLKCCMVECIDITKYIEK